MSKKANENLPIKTDFIPNWYLRATPEQREALDAIDVCFGVNPDQPLLIADASNIGRFALSRGWTQVTSRNPAIEIYEHTKPDQQIQVPISGHIDDQVFMLAEVLVRLAAAESLTLDELRVALGIERTTGI